MSPTRLSSAPNVADNWMVGWGPTGTRFCLYGDRELPPLSTTVWIWIFASRRRGWPSCVCLPSLRFTGESANADTDSTASVLMSSLSCDAARPTAFGRTARSIRRRHPQTMLGMDGYSVQNAVMSGRAMLIAAFTYAPAVGTLRDFRRVSRLANQTVQRIGASRFAPRQNER